MEKIFQFMAQEFKIDGTLKPILTGFRVDSARHIPTVPMRK
jgi:hypothetical protein